MSEAERRFARAQYYQALLKEQLFQDDNSQTATEVVTEIRGFIRSRLAVLLGIQQERSQVADVFSAEEVKALKQVAARVLKKPDIVQAPAVPTLKQVQAPAGPAVKASRGPAVKAAAPAAEPKSLPKKGPTRTGEFLEIKEGEVTRRYEKVIGDKQGEYYIGPNGGKFIVATNDAGQSYMRSVGRQARPVGVQPLPPMTTTMMANLAAQQVDQTMKSSDVSTITAVNATTK